jgi:predicted RNA-binding protein
MAIDISPYPKYPEYKLISGIYNGKTYYKRGCDNLMFDHPEYKAWRKYILTHYKVPNEKKILVLHHCSWSKPYDFSYIIKPIKDVCDQYSIVHRAIISNVGIIPYELQMNSVFCSYDFNPILINKEQRDRLINANFGEHVKKNLYDYLFAHNNSYEHIVIYYPPIKTPYLEMLLSVCMDSGIKTLIAPLKSDFIDFKNKEYFNREEVFTEPMLLKSLDKVINKLMETDK